MLEEPPKWAVLRSVLEEIQTERARVLSSEDTGARAPFEEACICVRMAQWLFLGPRCHVPVTGMRGARGGPTVTGWHFTFMCALFGWR